MSYFLFIPQICEIEEGTPESGANYITMSYAEYIEFRYTHRGLTISGAGSLTYADGGTTPAYEIDWSHSISFSGTATGTNLDSRTMGYQLACGTYEKSVIGSYADPANNWIEGDTAADDSWGSGWSGGVVVECSITTSFRIGATIYLRVVASADVSGQIGLFLGVDGAFSPYLVDYYALRYSMESGGTPSAFGPSTITITVLGTPFTLYSYDEMNNADPVSASMGDITVSNSGAYSY